MAPRFKKRLNDMQEMMAAVDAVATPNVAIWMNWMFAIFVLSVVFVWKYKGARVVLTVFILSIPAGVLFFQWTKDPWLLGVVHIVFWLPLAVYLLTVEFKRPEVRTASIYGVWLILLLATIAISLVLDVRDLSLIHI